MPSPDDYTETLAEKAVLGGQYEVVRKLGEGGMGEVHLAKDLHLGGRLVAIKTLPSLRAASPRAMKQLQREAAAMVELTHEHIVRFYHFGFHESLPFMVLQYVEGQTLDDLLGEKERLTEAETIELARPLAEALDYAHSKGVIHRDLKPSNIFIDGAGKPYLADFGIARRAKDTITRVTGRDATSGTLHYMSPEQCRGEIDLTPASDIFSFATVLYECLRGEVPFPTGPIRELILHQDPTRLQGDTELGVAIMAGLAKEQSHRPRSAEGLLGRTVEGPGSVRSSVAPLVGTAAGPVGRSAGDLREIDLGVGVTAALVWISPGSFEMGSPRGEKGRFRDEGPRHTVTFARGFWLCETEVTQGQWEAVMDGENPSYHQGSHLPVEQVSWDDCQEFLGRLDQRGIHARLPTEAEWEYACRAGTKTAYGFGDDETGLGDHAWYYENSGTKSCSVRRRTPNAWGLYDMHGNVWEWCEDVWHESYSGAPADGSAWVTGGDQTRHVLRGGSWGGYPRLLRSAIRRGGTSGGRGSVGGFRFALDSE